MKRTMWIWACAAALAAVGGASTASAAAPSRALPASEVAEELFSAVGGVDDPAPGAAQVEPVVEQDPDGSPLGRCWSKELLRSDGFWPYTRRLFLYTVWCGHAGVITYRDSSARTSHDWACWNNPTGPHVARTYGGAGFGVVEVQAWVTVSCHSPTFWPTFNDTLMLRVQYYPWGGYATVAWD